MNASTERGNEGGVEAEREMDAWMDGWLQVNSLMNGNQQELLPSTKRATNCQQGTTDLYQFFQCGRKSVKKIVHKQLYDFLTESNILNDAQSGFRKKVFNPK